MGVSDTLGKELRDKNDFKTEKNIGNKKSEILFLKKRQIKPKERHLIVDQRVIASDVLVWGNEDFGVWGEDNWGSTAQASFILGNPDAGILGESQLGSQTSEWERIRVVNPNRNYIDNLYSTTFKDTSSTTASWSGDGQIVFGTSSETATSLSIYKNQETITSATLTATETGSGSLTYFMSADTGSNFETVTNGEEHEFTNTGQDLRFKATGSDKAITKIDIEY